VGDRRRDVDDVLRCEEVMEMGWKEETVVAQRVFIDRWQGDAGTFMLIGNATGVLPSLYSVELVFRQPKSIVEVVS
jgi:hypothetical protein